MSVGSGSLRSLPLSVDLDAHPLATTPGELVAGAIGAMFAWLVAQRLLQAGTHAHELTAGVSVSGVTEDSGKCQLGAVAATLVGRVPGIDHERLDGVAHAAIGATLEALRMHDDELSVTVQTVLEGS